MNPQNGNDRTLAVIGGGPAGLMAAEVASAAGLQVHLYDAMASCGRKFLLAGKGGLNLTHAENFDAFTSRYGTRREQVEPWLRAFDADALRQWARGLGVETFVGSSDRVFPSDMKAAPLMRGWLRRLREQGVRFHMRHRCLGWHHDGALRFATSEGERAVQAGAVVLALGGGSWAKLGSDGAWVPWLTERGVSVAPLMPSNCGFDVAWSEHLRTRFAGEAVKSVRLRLRGDIAGRIGEFIVTRNGVEGSAIYALSARLRDEIARHGMAILEIDLAPDKSLERLIDEIDHPRGSRSMGSHLASRTGIKGLRAALLREIVPAVDYDDPRRLAAAIKALPLRLVATRPIDEAISSAGGVRFDGLDEHLMIRKLPGVFCAGEMLDWEAPTGGYLLTASMASGRVAGEGAVSWLSDATNRAPHPSEP